MFHVKHNKPYSTLDKGLNSVSDQLQYLQDVTEQFGLPLSFGQIRLFEIYTRQIIIWNQKTNLIAKNDIPRIAQRHIFESLLLTKAADFQRKIKVLDVGTGAGFPGIPLYIWNPDIELILIESNRKKIIFLELMKDMLNLSRVNVYCGRAEDAAQNVNLAKSFDIVVARAVAPLEKLLTWSMPFLKKCPDSKSMCLFPKGSNVSDELKKIDDDIWSTSTTDLTKYTEHKDKRLITITALLSIF